MTAAVDAPAQPTPRERSGRRSQRVAAVLFGATLVLAIVFAVRGGHAGAWGLAPILLYAALALAGVDVVLATIGALVVAAVMTRTTLLPLGAQMATSLGAFTTTIGVIILLGAALGQVAQRTGAAEALVGTIMNAIGLRTRTRVQLGVMASALVIVGALGTLAGGNAILAPIIIPICARTKWRPAAVAAMLHGAGAVGLFVGPFSPPCVTVRAATHMSYGTYLVQAGLPLGAVVLVTSFVMTRVIQHRATVEYTEDDAAEDASVDAGSARAKQSAAVFVLSLVGLTVYGIVVKAEFTYAIIVMIATMALTGLAGRLGAEQILQTAFEGAKRLIWLFFLFWLLDPLLELVNKTGAFQSIYNSLQPTLKSAGAFAFLLLVLVLGFAHAVPGAAVAQVVLLNKLFGSIVVAFAVPAGAWALVLLAVSQVDQHGPVPGADMIGQMGLARSSNLRLMLAHGIAVLLTGTAVIVVILAFRT